MTEPVAPMQTSALPVLRAAYSDRTAFLMATLSRLAYAYPMDGVSRGLAAEIPADFSRLGFDRITFFHNRFVDGWAFVVEGEDIVAVAFRGTQSIRNWETNFQMTMINPPATDPNLRVHRGFYRAFDELSDGLRGLGDKIGEIEQANSKIPIYFTGHSLGGALAQIAAAVFGSDRIAACYTFGSPRVGNAIFDLWVKPPSYRVENYADIVPQVPVFAPRLPLPTLYRHSGDPRYLPDIGDNSPYRYEPGLPTRAWQLLRGLLQFARTQEILGIEDHRILEYERKLGAIAHARSQAR